MTAADLAEFHRDDARQTVEMPAVQLPADPNVIAFAAPRDWDIGSVFAKLRRLCGIVEPREIVIKRTDSDWTAKARLR